MYLYVCFVWNYSCNTSHANCLVLKDKGRAIYWRREMDNLPKNHQVILVFRRSRLASAEIICRYLMILFYWLTGTWTKQNGNRKIIGAFLATEHPRQKLGVHLQSPGCSFAVNTCIFLFIARSPQFRHRQKWLTNSKKKKKIWNAQRPAISGDFYLINLPTNQDHK